MENKPKIVLDLLKEEKLGKLRAISQDVHEEIEVCDNCSEDFSVNKSNEMNHNINEEKILNFKDNETNLQISSDNKYRLITENTSDLISMTTFSMNPVYTYISPSNTKYLGYEPEELIGKNSFDFLHPDDKKNLTPLIKKYISMKAKKILTGKEHEIVEKVAFRVIDKSGKWHFLESTVNIVGKELLFISKDITEQKKIEEKLKISELKYSHLVEGTDDFVSIFKADGEITYVNHAAKRILGYSDSEFIGQSIFDFVHSEDLEKTRKNFIDWTDTHVQKVSYENRLVGDDGKIHFMLWTINIHYNEHGDLEKVHGIARDITDRKKLNDRFKMIARVSTDLIYEWNINNDTLEWIGDFDKALGYKEDEIPNDIDAWLKLIHPDDVNKLKDFIEQHRTSTIPLNEEYRLRKKDGTWLYWKDKSIPILGENGLPVKWIGGCKNITERIESKEAKKYADSVLEKRNYASRILFDTSIEVEKSNSKEIFEILCRNLRKISNAKYAALASFNSKTNCIKLEAVDIEGEDNCSLKSKDFEKAIEITPDVVEDIKQEQVRKCEDHHNCLVSLFPEIIIDFKDYSFNNSVCYRLSCVREDNLIAVCMIQLPDQNRLIMKDMIDTYINLTGMIIERINNLNYLTNSEELYRNLSENLEKTVNERTIEVKKLLTMKDEFINQLSHDLKTPLVPLVTLTPLLKKRTDGKSETLEIVDAIEKSTRQMKDMVDKTLQLARLNSSKLELNFEWTNLFIELKNAIKNNQYLFDENNIDLNNLVDEEINVQVDKNQLYEVLKNLFTNAVKYSKDNKGNIIINVDQGEEENIVVSVKDDGIGLTNEQQTLIFDEFYKTDESRHDIASSGLGLSICKRIIELHDGKIWAESDGLGKGCTFYFTLKTGGKK
ncbi:hypothetical protein B6U98_00110 [Thermoplasmatales archaeon ex4572_165]|nr:MAG: hypothetical protein B6U98_00110 [Thermoplasmatales archaeon ex4572_165]